MSVETGRKRLLFAETSVLSYVQNQVQRAFGPDGVREMRKRGRFMLYNSITIRVA